MNTKKDSSKRQRKAPELLPATPENMAALFQLLISNGIELRVHHDCQLYIRDSQNRLTEDDRAALRYYAKSLADWVTKTVKLPANSKASARARSTGNKDPKCSYCGSQSFTNVPTHDGLTNRRDCTHCKRTWGFSSWRGIANAEPDSQKGRLNGQ